MRKRNIISSRMALSRNLSNFLNDRMAISHRIEERQGGRYLVLSALLVIRSRRMVSSDQID
jgi:hypothetical protein